MERLSFKTEERQLNAFVKAYVISLEQPERVAFLRFKNNGTYRMHLDVQTELHVELPEEYEHQLMDSCCDVFTAWDSHQFFIGETARHVVVLCFQPFPDAPFGIDQLVLSDDEIGLDVDYQEIYRRPHKDEQGSTLARALMRVKQRYRVLRTMLDEIENTGFDYSPEALGQALAENPE